VTNFAWQTRAALRGSVATAALSLAMLVGPSALAQDTAAAGAPAEQAIVVTGTRVARPNLEQSSPVTIVDAVEIGFRQPINAEEFLREVPGVVPNIGAGVNNGANGSAQLDLRGLGSNRNLVLLDGRRVVPATNAGVVDLNLIPVALIERTDVFTGGASSVYGADAIAGVVNFVTRRDFAGVDLTSSLGLAEAGDGQTFRTDLTIGANFGDGRGNVVLSIGYSDTNPVLQGDRSWGEVSLSSGNGLPQGSATATPATILFPFTAAVSETPGAPFVLGSTNNFNFNPLNVYQTPLERYSLFSKANYEVTDRLEVYAQGMYVRNVIDQQIAPSGTFFSTVNLPLSNPFLSAAQRNQLCVGYGISQQDCNTAATVTTQGAPGYIEQPIQIGRRFTEAGPRRTNFRTDTFQFTAGMRGPLTETLEWDAYWSYGESSRTNTNEAQGLRSRLQQALRASNTTTCTVTTGGCVPINLFGPDGTVTQQAFNFLNVQTFNFIRQQFTTVQGTISGDLGFASPWASEAIGIATGIEYRKFKGQSGGDGLSAVPGEVLGAGAAALPIRGQYDTTELFGEVIIPIIEDRPFFQNLTLEAGFRYSDYSISGGNWAYKIGGSWIPVDGIKIRGNYARAVRAPNIGELFQPQVTGLTNRTVDPCQLSRPTGNATLTALCAAQLAAVGAPASQLGQIPAPIAGQINFTSGGNPDLDVETADTYTIGAVFTPGFLPGFAATIDYYNIHLFDAISNPSQGDVIDACFAQTDPNFAQCQLIRRNPLTGGLSGPNDTTFGPFLGLSNLGTIKTSGIDFGVNYRVDAGFANFNFAWNGNYTISNRFQATPTSVERECAGYYSVNCGPIQPEWSWNARATMLLPSDTEISIRWRYIGGVELEPLINPATIFDDYESIGAFSYFDMALSQQIGEHFRLTLTIDNLFNRAPPVVGNTIGTTAFNSGNTYPTTYDAIGRRYRLGLNLRF
jgi:iron complex outermembrane receptor protein